MDWRGKTVVIVGLGRQGNALARYLSGKGALLSLTDNRPEEELADVRQELADLDAEWVLGGHPLNILDNADMVCPSAGVPLTIPLIQEAQKRSIPLSNDSQIFLDTVSCKVIGITGSAGKTTTTTLVGRMAEAAVKLGSGYRRAYVGGNIGNPLIAEADEMQSNDLAVMELSSFQLQIMTSSPQVAAILNITPNHLDRHKDMQEYSEAKKQILRGQGMDDTAVLNREDPGSWEAHEQVVGNLLTFGQQAPPPEQFGTFEDLSYIWLRTENSEQKILPIGDIELRGQHNLMNVLAACAIAAAADLPVEAMQEGVYGFTGVEHRLEMVRSWGGAKWYNDSIATAPERTIAAIHSFDEPLVLLIGGRDKHLPWDEFARLAARRVDHIVLFGEMTGLVSDALKKTPGKYSLDVCGSLDEAVQTAAKRVSPGDVVLLSPGGTSYDQYIDFEQRGQEYKRLVNAL
jgi:UDP-N-acetylmuramoylalanine--D-glutamate ligase